MKVEERYHTLEEVAKMLHCSRETLRKWTIKGKLPTNKLSARVWRLHPSIVRNLLRHNPLQKSKQNGCTKLISSAQMAADERRNDAAAAGGGASSAPAQGSPSGV